MHTDALKCIRYRMDSILFFLLDGLEFISSPNSCTFFVEYENCTTEQLFMCPLELKRHSVRTKSEDKRPLMCFDAAQQQDLPPAIF